MALRKKKEVIDYVSHHDNFEEWMADFATHLKTYPDQRTVRFPANFALGYTRIFQISDGLSYRLVDYTLTNDFLFERVGSSKFFLILYLYIYTDCHRLEFEINRRTIVENQDIDYSTFLMTNSFTNQKLRITKGAKVKGLTIQMSEDWLKRNLNSSTKLNLDLLKSKDVFQSLILPGYRKLITEIFNPDVDSVVPDLYLSCRIISLLEMFFGDIYRNGLEANSLPVSTRDVQSLFEVEQYLIDHFREPFPSINTLSRLAIMSSSKLKQSFKKAFGTGLFEYYQRNRMLKAREMLISKTHTVTEVGEFLGYQNLSNFSVAFKKEFGILPKDVNKFI